MNPQNIDPNERLRHAARVQPLSELEPHPDRSSVVDVPPPPPRYHTARQQAGRPQRYYPWKKIAAIVAVIVVLGAAAFAVPSVIDSISKSSQRAATPPPPAAAPTSIRLMAAGDFIAHDSVNAAALKDDGTYDYLPLMSSFVPLFKKADIRFCNDPILNGGKQYEITGYPEFNSPTEFVRDMGRLGCNLVNTASNHSFDKTQDVISASMFAWDKVPNMLAVAGQNRTQEERSKVRYFTVDGVKFAFLAYTTYTNKPVQNSFGVNVFSEEFASNQIKEAKANGAQFIIASMRWGTEYANEVNADQQAKAQFLADQGVDLVLGHGPHVLQTVDELVGASGKKTLVWYSLGNFINSQIPPETLFNGLAIMNIDIKTKKISKTQYLPIYMQYKWNATQAAAQDLDARYDLKIMPLENATQAMLDAQQLKTTIAAQKERITNLLTANNLQIPLITTKDL
ncbi:MAG TPA: CapA family protein [Candidatus Saccharimonadales bacterium]|nr:CapA family protein [Candidatus Saccharimonadales bacterium]